ncbi:hypothetical protein [Pseudaquabacterium pictum]|uniref:Uncharacterized protein n=1 Tax=Pseudaquabacterium pictum TaxID=2315236 RepID=A0A480AX19_9BURK|nr:hypothetical protein [Rubrivivax pictus]GCL64345.1 hypothetical protein AQPW35_34260 [Rubrivivax pictus]
MTAATTTAEDDRWLRNAVIDGVQLLYSLALPGSPAGEVLPLTAQGWIEVLCRCHRWDAERDSARLHPAFVSLAGAVDRWPAPKQLLDHLPALPAEPVLAYRPPPLTPERRAQLEALRRRLADRLTATPQSRAVNPCRAEPDALQRIATSGIFPSAPPSTGQDQPGCAETA